MLLRTTSTPLLGSFLLHEGKTFRFFEKSNQGIHQNSVACAREEHSSGSIRRVRSETDLRNRSGSISCAFGSPFGFSDDDFHPLFFGKPSSQNRSDSLKPMPSFSVYCHVDTDGMPEKERSDDSDLYDFSFGNISLSEMIEDAEADECNEKDAPFESGSRSPGFDEHYQRQIELYPEDALLLGNYARYLCEIKKDPRNAEKCFKRALAADPEDGEILTQYAKFLWEFKGDQREANAIFEKAAEKSSEDCHILAARACFLWKTKEDEALSNSLTGTSREKCSERWKQKPQSHYFAAQAYRLWDIDEDEAEPETESAVLQAAKAYALWNTDEHQYSSYNAEPNSVLSACLKSTKF